MLLKINYIVVYNNRFWRKSNIIITEEIMLNILTVFLTEKIILEHGMDGYITDLYIPDYDLAVKFDTNVEYYRWWTDLQIYSINFDDDIFLKIGIIYHYIKNYSFV